MVLFGGLGLNFFHPWEELIQKQHINWHWPFQLSTPKGIVEASAVNLSYLNTCRGTKPVFMKGTSVLFPHGGGQP